MRPYMGTRQHAYIGIIDPVILKTMEKSLMRDELIQVLETEILTEENTDVFIDLVLGFVKLPLWLRWLPLRSILDKLLPEAVLKAIKALAQKKADEAEG